MNKLPSLKTCIILDLVGCASYILPFVGEAFDSIWAPVSAVIYFFMFGSKMGVRGALFEFIEEWLPFTDIIPTFTISYFIRKSEMGKVKVVGEQ